MKVREENMIEITMITQLYISKGKLECFSHQEVLEMILEITDEFGKAYGTADWNELDYYDEIIDFTNMQIAQRLWNNLEPVPKESETGAIKEEWNIFSAGTSIEDIRNWFRESFKVTVQKL